MLPGSLCDSSQTGSRMSPLVIFTNIVLPVFLLMSIGYALDRALQLDIQTLTRLIFYVLSPAIVFLTLAGSDLLVRDMLQIAGFTLGHELAMMLLALLIFSSRPFADKRTVLTFGSVFYNSGNYGFPLMLLAFGEAAVGKIAIVLVVQTIVLYTLGLLLFVGFKDGLGDSLRRLVRVPVLYAVLAGVVFRAFDWQLGGAVGSAVGRLGDAFVGVALLTLGAQLSRSRVASGDAVPVSGLVVMRLLISPLVAAGMAAALGLPPDLSAVLVVAAGLPMAVNIFVIAKEFDRQPELASRLVFWTTLLSAFTVPLLLWLLR